MGWGAAVRAVERAAAAMVEGVRAEVAKGEGVKVVAERVGAAMEAAAKGWAAAARAAAARGWAVAETAAAARG